MPITFLSRILGDRSFLEVPKPASGAGEARMQEQSLHALNLNDWQYCLHCRRVSRSLEWRAARGRECCPYDDCDSDFYGGSCSYQSFRRCYPELPATPAPGVVYTRSILTLLVSGHV